MTSTSAELGYQEQVWDSQRYPSNLSDYRSIMREVIVRLSWYDYDAAYEWLDEHLHKRNRLQQEVLLRIPFGSDREIAGLLDVFDHPLWPQKPLHLREIEEFNEHEKSTGFLPQESPSVQRGPKQTLPPPTYEHGWVIRDHIEGNNRSQSPYKHPRSTYKDYLPALNPDPRSNRAPDLLMESTKLEMFQVRRQRKDPSKWNKSAIRYSESVYRLKPNFGNDPRIFELMMSFLELHDGLIDERFLMSPYWAKWGDDRLYQLAHIAGGIRKRAFQLLLDKHLPDNEQVEYSRVINAVQIENHALDIKSLIESSDYVQGLIREFKQAVKKLDRNPQNNDGQKDQKGKCPRRTSTERDTLPPIIASYTVGDVGSAVLVLTHNTTTEGYDYGTEPNL